MKVSIRQIGVESVINYELEGLSGTFYKIPQQLRHRRSQAWVQHFTCKVNMSLKVYCYKMRSSVLRQTRIHGLVVGGRGRVGHLLIVYIHQNFVTLQTCKTFI